eukprot:2943987-Lingulodinium_polyedra.AAC.1
MLGSNTRFPPQRLASDRDVSLPPHLKLSSFQLMLAFGKNSFLCLASVMLRFSGPVVRYSMRIIKPRFVLQRPEIIPA